MPQFISDERGPFGRNAAPTAAIRQAIRDAGSQVPVVCTGGIHNFEMAEDYLARGVCDIVGAARQSLADPDWFRKFLLGFGSEVRVCEYTNYCEGLDQKHKPVTCQLWDKLPSAERKAHARWQAPHDRAGLAAADLNVTMRTDRALAFRRGNELTRIRPVPAGRRCRRTRR